MKTESEREKGANPRKSFEAPQCVQDVWELALIETESFLRSLARISQVLMEF